MRPIARLAASLSPMLLLAAPVPRTVDAAETTLHVVVLVPSGDIDAALSAEIAYGASLAVAASNDAKSGGAKRPTVEMNQTNAGDSAIAALTVERSAKDKCAGVVAMATDAVAPVLEVVARKSKIPLLLVGPGGPTRTLDPNDPVFHVEPSAADRGFALSEWLRFRSARPAMGLPPQTKKAWVVAEDVPWALDVANALKTNDVDGIVSSEVATTERGRPPASNDISRAQASCDRVVVLGGPKTLAVVVSMLDQAQWDVPVLCLDTALTSTPPATKRRIVYVAATPAWAEERHLDDIAAKHPPAGGRPGPVTAAAVRGYVAAAALIDAALAAGKRTVAASLRDAREGAGPKEWPLFDPTGFVDHWRWCTWTVNKDNALAPMTDGYLPDPRFGPFLGSKPGARYRPQAGAVCVRVGFGGAPGQAEKTIDADLATIGLVKEAGPVYDMARDQILARTCGKLSRVWSRNYDGSARPGLSWKIAFVPESNETKGASTVWHAVIAGDGPDGLHGGQAFPNPKQMIAQALSTYLIRHATPMLAAKLTPPLSTSDATYLDGTYAWNTSNESNLRSEQIRALLEGAASTFCMKLCKELGHLANLGVDHSGEPRSVMVAKGGEGVSDEFAYFSPPFAKTLEKSLGRVPAEGK